MATFQNAQGGTSQLPDYGSLVRSGDTVYLRGPKGLTQLNLTSLGQQAVNDYWKGKGIDPNAFVEAGNKTTYSQLYDWEGAGRGLMDSAGYSKLGFENLQKSLGVGADAFREQNQADLFSGLQQQYGGQGSWRTFDDFMRDYVTKANSLDEFKNAYSTRTIGGGNVSQSVSPDNPYGTVTKVDNQVVSQSPSLQASLASAGGTPGQIEALMRAAQENKGQGPAGMTGAFTTPQQQAAGIVAPPVQPNPQQMQAIQQASKPGYGASSYTGPSIVDYLSSLNQPSDFASRAKLAQQFGIQDYKGTAEQNTRLLGILRGQQQGTANPMGGLMPNIQTGTAGSGPLQGGISTGLPMQGGTSPYPAYQGADLTGLESEFNRLMAPGDEEMSLEKQLAALMASRDLGLQKTEDQPVAMPFITGQQASIEKMANIKAGTLQNQLALAQARRQASLDVAKSKLEQAKYKEQQAREKYEFDKKYALGERELAIKERPEDPKRSAIYQEYLDAVGEGYKGNFTQYQNEDANRKKPVTNVNVNGSGLTPYQVFQATQDLSKTLQRNTDASREVTTKYNQMQAAYNRLASGEARDLNATTQAIISTFNRIIEPGSVTREAEYARSPQGLALMDRLEGMAARLNQGGAGLTQASLKEFVDLAGTFAANAQQSLDAEKERVSANAKAFGLDPSLIVGSTNNTTTTANPQADLEDDIRTLSSQMSREQIIAEISKDYPEFTVDEVAKAVYTLIPDKK